MGSAPLVTIDLALQSRAPIDSLATTLFGLICFAFGVGVGAAFLAGMLRRPSRFTADHRSDRLPLDHAYLAQRAEVYANAQGRPDMAVVLTQFLVHAARRAERLRRRWDAPPPAQRRSWWP
jgi:hypothetical protein